MLKSYFPFSSDVKPRHNRAIRVSLLLLASGSISLADAPLDMPEVTLRQQAAPQSSGTALVGDRITFLADLKSPRDLAGEVITLKPIDDKTPLEDQGWFLVQGTLNQNGSLSFIASPLKKGELTLPALLIVGVDTGPIAKTAPFKLMIGGPEQNPDQKPEYIDVISMGLPAKYWFLLGVIFIGIGLGFFFGYRRWKAKRKPRQTSVPTAPPEPDHVVALRKIDELYIRFPFSPENLKIASFGVSEIIKEYFSKRFGIEAMESTTDEMIMLLRREALSGDQLRAIQMLFNELDQFKFTKVEDYPSVYEETQTNIKIKATLIIQKWAMPDSPGEHSK